MHVNDECMCGEDDLQEQCVVRLGDDHLPILCGAIHNVNEVTSKGQDSGGKETQLRQRLEL